MKSSATTSGQPEHPGLPWARYAVPACVLAAAPFLWFGCLGRERSTEQLLADLKSSQEKERLVAVRLLPLRKGEAAQSVPALIEALKGHDHDIRRSAAIGLGNFGESAKDAIPALQAALKDGDARVRESAGVALTRIDPIRFPAPPTQIRKKG